MTIVQSFCCKDCGYRFGPVGIGPYVRERPQVFRFCRACSRGQTMIHEPGTQLRCVHCQSPDLVDLQGKCPLCSSANVGWV